MMSYVIASDSVNTLYRTFVGYAFLLFTEEESIHKLVMSCLEEDDKHYMYISSPTYKEKKVRKTLLYTPIKFIRSLKNFCGFRQAHLV